MTGTATQSRLSTPSARHEAHYRSRARVGDLIAITLWVSSAISVGLFLVSGGTARFGSASDAVTSLGIMAGLVGTNFVLAMLIFAARIPVIDRAIGHDRAIAVHRALGKPAFLLLIGHALLLLIGYAFASGLNPIAEIAPLFAIPDMWLALVGIILLTIVVGSSLASIRHRFSYETWHLIHLVSYAAVLVSIPHQLSIGSVFLPLSFERAYWLVLYLLAFGAIFTHRFLEPLLSSIRHNLRVDRVVIEAPGVVSIYLRGRRLHSLRAAGGQFLVWRFWTPGTWWHSHPISLSAAPTDTELRITVRDLGEGSRSISAVRAGTRVWFEGPYGVFTDAGRTAKKLAIVVAGIGITPVRALLQDSRLLPGEASVLLRASTPNDTFLWGEIDELARDKGITVTKMIGPRSTSGPGWMTEKAAERGATLQNIFPDLTRSDLYLCGPTAWLTLIEADAQASGLPHHQIHAERFDW
ncbi:ferredoxin reductase family protein [Lacisediminihabitans changchengi]|uniref:ferredoxin reductase family protein n=1 Tax=Lacisediminihabitans changchengi TaxID=2787634 RepID=UPI001F3A37A7|nr:ferredoxin reductase family protein [Lacisediminihabitans changchengi]